MLSPPPICDCERQLCDAKRPELRHLGGWRDVGMDREPVGPAEALQRIRGALTSRQYLMPQRSRHGSELPASVSLGFNLNPAVQTAKDAEYAKGKRLRLENALTRWGNRIIFTARSCFVCFACFAVPTAFSRFNLNPGLHGERKDNASRWRKRQVGQEGPTGASCQYYRRGACDGAGARSWNLDGGRDGGSRRTAPRLGATSPPPARAAIPLPWSRTVFRQPAARHAATRPAWDRLSWSPTACKSACGPPPDPSCTSRPHSG